MSSTQMDDDEFYQCLGPRSRLSCQSRDALFNNCH